MSDIFAKGLEVRKIASAMMFFVTRRNEEKFTLSNANQDFGILLSNVRIVLRDWEIYFWYWTSPDKNENHNDFEKILIKVKEIY